MQALALPGCDTSSARRVGVICWVLQVRAWQGLRIVPAEAGGLGSQCEACQPGRRGLRLVAGTAVPAVPSIQCQEEELPLRLLCPSRLSFQVGLPLNSPTVLQVLTNQNWNPSIGQP